MSDVDTTSAATAHHRPVRSPMPWFWTDDLARTLIDSGKVDQSKVSGWLSAPVAIRSGEESAETVAQALLGDGEDPDLPGLPLAA